MSLKTLKDIEAEEIPCCKECGKPTNQDDGWCFECSDTPKTDLIRFLKNNDLKQEAIKIHKSKKFSKEQCVALRFFCNINGEDLK